MEQERYRPEPIPPRAQRPTGASHRPSPRTPMNGSRADARAAIARILSDERFQTALRSTARRQSTPVAASTDDEPPRRTDSPGCDSAGARGGGSSALHRSAGAGEPPAGEALFSSTAQPAPAFELPDRYRRMRAISRWQEGTDGKPGRWLTEAELFWRQGAFMADWEDDCPYHGIFKSYFPTYNAMSDRQLRGYFTWRAAVRAGDVQETSLSFAYVYLYELINGIGVADPLDGFRKIEAFWRAYRAFAPELDRFVNVWLQDYAVYHGLDPELLAPYKTLAFDRALIALRHADAEMARTAMRGRGGGGGGAMGPGPSVRTPEPPRRRKRGEPTIPLPPDAAREKELFEAIDALSTYRPSNSRLAREAPDALRHVSCAVYARLSERHRRQGKKSLLESWFGEEVALPYTMFGSAVFFERTRHADTAYELDEIHRYRCERGLWTCERYHGSRQRSPKLGAAMRAVDRTLRAVYDAGHPLKDDGKTPKYLQRIIDQEVEAWRTWSAAHVPVRVDIDLSRLAGIRSAAAETREALLIDEEREGDGALVAAADGTATHDGPADPAEEQRCKNDVFSELTDPLRHVNRATLSETRGDGSADLEGAEPAGGPLAPGQAAYLRALLDGGRERAADEANAAGASEDLLVDAVNEALFDLIGDTVIEYGPDGTPRIIEDYRDDVEGILNHE